MTDVIPYTRQSAVQQFNADWLLDPAEIAQRIGGTDFVPAGLRNNPAAITAALLYGAEAGLGPMQALAKIAVINGRPTMSAEAQRALILNAGHEIWFEESTITRCTVCGQRRDSTQVSRVTWTIDDAKRANLAGKQNWRMYPRQMLQARASAELARAVFADVIAGMAATEELEDEPALGQAANGPEPKAKTTRRSRKTTVTATAEESKPPADDLDLKTVAELAEAQKELDPEAAQDLEDQVREAQVIKELEDTFDAKIVEPEPEPLPEPVTESQMKKMMALFREKGLADRDERLTYARGVLGRDIKSSKDITVYEASAIITHLEQYAEDDPQTHPLPEGF